MERNLPVRTGANSPLRVDAKNPPRTGAQKTRRKGSPTAKGKGTKAARQLRAAPAKGSVPPAAVAPGATPKLRRAAAVISLALAAAWLTGLSGAADRPAGIWRGYETLLLRSDIARSGGLLKVVNVFGPAVVSGVTATASFWDFTGVQSIPVAQIDTRIDPSDPRHDRAMDSLPGYFHTSSGPAGGWSIAYIPSRGSAAIEYFKVAAVLGLPAHGRWRMLEFDAFELLVSVVGLLALAALLAWPFRRDGRVRLFVAGAGTLLWIPFLFTGGLARVALALFLYASWFQVVEVFTDLRGSDEKLLRSIRDPLARFLAAAGMGLVLYFGTSGISSAALAEFAGPVIASVLFVIAMALSRSSAPRPRERRKKFEPVPIVKPVTSPVRPGQAGFVLVFVAVLAVGAIELARSASIPTPLPFSGAHDYSWESLALLSRHKEAARLPDISDLVTHEAFQQTLAFGRPWSMPRRDERVYVREFSMNGRDGSIVEGLRRVKVFDSSWLDSVTRHAAPGSIEGMLIAQGGPVAVAYRGQLSSLLRDLPLAVLVLFVFSAWFVRDRRTAPLMKNALVRLNGPARRNQVP